MEEIGANVSKQPDEYKKIKFSVIRTSFNPEKYSFKSLKVTGTEHGQYKTEVLSYLFNTIVYEELIWKSIQRNEARRFLSLLKDGKEKIPSSRINAVLTKMNVLKRCACLLIAAKHKNILKKKIQKEAEKIHGFNKRWSRRSQHENILQGRRPSSNGSQNS